MTLIKSTKTVLFASLIAAMILPFSGVGTAYAKQTDAVYDPVVTDYLAEILKDAGTTKTLKVVDMAKQLKTL